MPTHQDRPEPWLAREVPGQQQRGPVGPVQVVDDQQHGPFRGEPAHDRHDSAEHLAASRLGLPHRWQASEVRQALLDLGQQPGQLGGASDQLGQLGLRQAREVRPQHVDPRAERVQLLLVAAAVKHLEARHPLRQLGDGARLADAALAADEHEPGLAGHGALGERSQPAQAGVAADPRRGERLGEPVGEPVRAQRRAARRRPRSRRHVTGQQPLVQGAHGFAGCHPELVAQQHAHALVGGQRLRDLAARSERLHQQPMAGLAQRRLAHQLRRRPLGGVGVRSAEREPGLRERLERAQPQVVEVGAPLLHPRRVVAGEESAAGDLHRGRGGVARRRPVAARDRGPRALAGRPRLVDVDLGAGGQRQHQLPAPGQHVAPDRLAHLGQQRAQRLIGIRRRTVRPQRADQLVAGDRPVAVDHQHRQHERTLAARQPLLDPPAVELDLQPPEEPDPSHATTLRPPEPTRSRVNRPQKVGVPPGRARLGEPAGAGCARRGAALAERLAGSRSMIRLRNVSGSSVQTQDDVPVGGDRGDEVPQVIGAFHGRGHRAAGRSRSAGTARRSPPRASPTGRHRAGMRRGDRLNLDRRVMDVFGGSARR